MGRLRSDAAASLLLVVGVLAGCARVDATSAPTWPVLVERTGLSRATVGRKLAWLGEHGLLVTIEHGSTPGTRAPRRRRGRALVVVEGNRAAVYLLTAPLPQEASTAGPTGVPECSTPGAGPARRGGVTGETPKALSPWEREITPAGAPARARARGKRAVRGGAAGEDQRRSPAGGRCEFSGYRHKVGGLSRGAQRAADLAVAERLRARSLDLREISDAAVRSVIRPFLAAGWGEEDLVHAIDHNPDGGRRTFTSGPTTPPGPDLGAVLDVDDLRRQRGPREVPARPVAYPAAWLAWRLRPWAGHPAPAAARRQTALADLAAARAATAARAAAAAAAVAAAVAPPPGFTTARQVLREALRSTPQAATTRAGQPGWLGPLHQPPTPAPAPAPPWGALVAGPPRSLGLLRGPGTGDETGHQRTLVPVYLDDRDRVGFGSVEAVTTAGGGGRGAAQADR